jgi:hypothetical protein
VTLTHPGATGTAAASHAGSPTVPAPRRAPVARVRTDERTGYVVVALAAGVACARSAAALSCTLHSAIESAVETDRSTVVVDLAGAPADDPGLARVLACAGESAAARGVDLRVSGDAPSAVPAD